MLLLKFSLFSSRTPSDHTGAKQRGYSYGCSIVIFAISFVSLLTSASGTGLHPNLSSLLNATLHPLQTADFLFPNAHFLKPASNDTSEHQATEGNSTTTASPVTRFRPLRDIIRQGIPHHLPSRRLAVAPVVLGRAARRLQRRPVFAPPGLNAGAGQYRGNCGVYMGIQGGLIPCVGDALAASYTLDPIRNSFTNRYPFAITRSGLTFGRANNWS